jgi:phosphoglycolate phosphatase
MKRQNKPHISNSKPAIIFDLDGTLADSISVLLEIINEMKIINRELTYTDYEKAKDLSVPAILKEFNIPLLKAPGLLVKGRGELTKRIEEVPFFAGMDKVVQSLAKDHRLFVMSSNSLENVQKFLELHGIRQSFEDVHGGVGIFSKAKMLKKIVKTHKMDSAETYYVGDEVRDIEAAKKAGLRSIAVTWGFNGEHFLRAHNPDYLVRTPKALQDVFK